VQRCGGAVKFKAGLLFGAAAYRWRKGQSLKQRARKIHATVVVRDAKGLLKAASTLAGRWSEILFTGGLQFLRKVIKIYPIIF